MDCSNIDVFVISFEMIDSNIYVSVICVVQLKCHGITPFMLAMVPS